MLMLYLTPLFMCSALSSQYQPNRNNDLDDFIFEELRSLKSKHTKLEEKCASVVEENRYLKESPENRRDKRLWSTETEVAFSTQVHTHSLHLTFDKTIVFDVVHTNIGRHYNKTTGIFTVPVTGTYMIFANILSDRDNEIETEIMADKDTIAEIYSANSGGFHGSGSNLVIFHLRSGQKVWVKVHEDYSTDMNIHCCWSTFSGYLLKRDDSSGGSLAVVG